MTISELTAYASKKYNIREQCKWSDFPGFSVLTHPKTDKWIALLMRQWDGDTGSMIERCDIKCGEESIAKYARPYLTPAVRMHGSKLVNIIFSDRTERDVVFDLLDKAVDGQNSYGYTFVVDHGRSTKPAALIADPLSNGRSEAGNAPGQPSEYYETALPASRTVRGKLIEATPERIKKLQLMFRLYERSDYERAGNFYRQATYMRNYNDDYPWDDSYSSFHPTYREMTVKQLRGYFSWRTHVRRGDYSPIGASSAYIYLFEVLNGINGETAEQKLELLRDFDRLYLKNKYGDQAMRFNVYRWMRDIALVNNMSLQVIRKYNDLLKDVSEPNAYEKAVETLIHPEDRPDKEIFNALVSLDTVDHLSNIAYMKYPARTEFIFSETWRRALSGYTKDGVGLLALCFGEKEEMRLLTFHNALYCHRPKLQNVEVNVDDTLSFICRDGQWYYRTYQKFNLNRKFLRSFMHAVDLKLRKYLKCGHELYEKPGENWVYPFAEEAIEADRRNEVRAARESFIVDLSGLDKIRSDAMETRNSLLTEEEEEEEHVDDVLTAVPESDPVIPLNSEMLGLLRLIINGDDPGQYINAHRIMPSLAADVINESLFEEIGDNIITCDDGILTLVEDYIDDVKHLIGG